MKTHHFFSFFIILSCLLNYNAAALYSEPSNNSLEEKEIVIVSLSRNNKLYYAENLASMLSQHYNNYRIAWVDDASTDGTPELVEAYLAKHDPLKKVTLIKNSVRCGALKNFYTVINACNDNAIIVVVDGDDFLAHNSVLEMVNKNYSNPDVWLTYGSFKPLHVNHWNPAYWTEIPADIIATNNFRNYRWVTSHLRTHYAWLFKLIKTEDLLYKGEFHPESPDVATMFPMLEMAGTHSKFVSDILLLYNDNAQQTNGRNSALEYCTYIANLKKYAPLTERPAKARNTPLK